ncbi:hypothetical protein ScPMuIL_014301 [Solemya velum]
MADKKVIVNNTERLKVFVGKFLDKGTTVEYHVSEEGHMFLVECAVQGQSSLGRAATKKRARQVAACRMLEQLGQQGVPVQAETAPPPDYVSELNKIIMRLRWSAAYNCETTEDKKASVTLNVQDLYTAVGTATNKRSAKQEAAKALLDLLPAMVLYIGRGKFGNVAMQSAHTPERMITGRKQESTSGIQKEFNSIALACRKAVVRAPGQVAKDHFMEGRRQPAICGLKAKGKVSITIDDEERSPLLHMVGAYEDMKETTAAPDEGGKTGGLDPEYRPTQRSLDNVRWLLGVGERSE